MNPDPVSTSVPAPVSPRPLETMKLEAHSFAQSAAVLHDPETASDVATIHPTGDPEKTRDLSSRLAACWNACHGLDIPADIALGTLAEIVAAARALLADRYLADPINDDRMAPIRAALAKLDPAPVSPPAKPYGYAVKTPEGYLANQGRESWHESEPVGWALYSTQEHAAGLAASHGGEVVEIFKPSKA